MVNVITNPDKELVKKIVQKIKENDGHCACAILFNDDNICMCKEFREQIAKNEPGECHCGLYIVTQRE